MFSGASALSEAEVCSEPDSVGLGVRVKVELSVTVLLALLVGTPEEGGGVVVPEGAEVGEALEAEELVSSSSSEPPVMVIPPQ